MLSGKTMYNTNESSLVHLPTFREINVQNSAFNIFPDTHLAVNEFEHSPATLVTGAAEAYFLMMHITHLKEGSAARLVRKENAHSLVHDLSRSSVAIPAGWLDCGNVVWFVFVCSYSLQTRLISSHLSMH